MTTFTNQQLGALLVAVGEQMWAHDKSFEEVMNGEADYDEMAVTIKRNLTKEEKLADVSTELLALWPKEVIALLK